MSHQNRKTRTFSGRSAQAGHDYLISLAYFKHERNLMFSFPGKEWKVTRIVPLTLQCNVTTLRVVSHYADTAHSCSTYRSFALMSFVCRTRIFRTLRRCSRNSIGKTSGNLVRFSAGSSRGGNSIMRILRLDGSVIRVNMYKYRREGEEIERRKYR